MSSKRIIVSALLISGLFVGSTTSSFADTASSPTPTVASHSSDNQAQLAYKLALAQYNVARITNDINYRKAMIKYWADWKATMQAFNASWQVTLNAFETAKAVYQAKFELLQGTHRAALEVAEAAFLTATAGSPSLATLTAAITAYWSAIKAENASFKIAVTALGAEPVRPVRPAEPVKPVAPVKPVDPIKPEAPKNK